MEIEAFEKTVMVIAMLVLVVTLILMAMSIKKPSPNTVVAAACPDFWFSSYYTPCASTPDGCCDDKVTPSTAANNYCEAIVAAADTPFGYCPDGYTRKTSADGIECPAAANKCYNINGLGGATPPDNGTGAVAPVVPEGNCAMEDFSQDKYMGSTGLCAKQTWAQTCHVSWDGVSNLPLAC